MCRGEFRVSVGNVEGELLLRVPNLFLPGMDRLQPILTFERDLLRLEASSDLIASRLFLDLSDAARRLVLRLDCGLEFVRPLVEKLICFVKPLAVFRRDGLC